MVVLRWTVEAADTFEAIAEYIATDSPFYAKLFAIDVMAAIERLKDFPLSGRMVPERGNPKFRELLCGSYRIIYRVEVELVQILMVHHTSRLLDPADLK